MCRCWSDIMRTVLITECLLRCVRGDGTDSEEKLDMKYVLIGGGIGLFLVALFIVFKVCIIRKQVHEKRRDERSTRPSVPHLITLEHLSQSQPPVAVVSSDRRC
ncbi:uncharacterized protein V6R79_011061 [Siganus canaliculatus]